MSTPSLNLRGNNTRRRRRRGSRKMFKLDLVRGRCPFAGCTQREFHSSPVAECNARTTRTHCSALHNIISHTYTAGIAVAYVIRYARSTKCTHTRTHTQSRVRMLEFMLGHTAIESVCVCVFLLLLVVALRCLLRCGAADALCATGHAATQQQQPSSNGKESYKCALGAASTTTSTR